MLKSFYHTGFVVKSLEESVKFYTETLGLNLKRSMFETGGDLTEQVTGLKGVKMKVAFVDLSNEHHLELIEYVYPPGTEAHTNINDTGAAHLAFYVEDADALYRDKSALGMAFVNPPAHRHENGKVGRKTFYARDPAGNWLEFIEARE